MRILASSDFTTFGTQHWIALVVFLAGIIPIVVAGRRLRGTDRAVVVSRCFAVALPVFTIPLQMVDFLPENYDFDTTLPLQLCDFAWIAATVALWTQHRFFVALTYFWGLALTTQALITPALVSGFPDPKFLAFWGMHYLIVWAAIFLVWGLGHTPTWRDYATTVATTFVWLVSVFCFNLAAGTNYGFVNEKPRGGSVLDYLGPWPAYVLLEIALVAAVWALMTWPWTARARREEPAANIAAC